MLAAAAAAAAARGGYGRRVVVNLGADADVGFYREGVK